MTTETIEAKIDGLQNVMEARFSSHEKEQAGIIAWMERLSASIERMVDFGNTVTALQHRTAAVEGSQSDMTLDIDALDTRLSNIEVNRKADAVRQGAISTGLGAALGALIGAVATKLVGT